jgi:hypothetical protein
MAVDRHLAFENILQYCGRPPSWIRKYLVLNVTSITKIFVRICMSSFLKIGEEDSELCYYIELQYGSRPPSWIYNNADLEVTPRTKLIFYLWVLSSVKIAQSVP